MDRQQAKQKIVRPAGEFMTDEDLETMVHCEQCDEALIKAFRHDHVCNPAQLAAMMRNQNGELARPPQPKPPL